MEFKKNQIGKKGKVGRDGQTEGQMDGRTDGRTEGGLDALALFGKHRHRMLFSVFAGDVILQVTLVQLCYSTKTVTKMDCLYILLIYMYMYASTSFCFSASFSVISVTSMFFSRILFSFSYFVLLLFLYLRHPLFLLIFLYRCSLLRPSQLHSHNLFFAVSLLSV